MHLFSPEAAPGVLWCQYLLYEPRLCFFGENRAFPSGRLLPALAKSPALLRITEATQWAFFFFFLLEEGRQNKQQNPPKTLKNHMQCFLCLYSYLHASAAQCRKPVDFWSQCRKPVDFWSTFLKCCFVISSVCMHSQPDLGCSWQMLQQKVCLQNVHFILSGKE